MRRVEFSNRSFFLSIFEPRRYYDLVAQLGVVNNYAVKK
jgi:hypothetical protein